MRYAFALALLFAPAAAMAQADGPVSVEIVSSGRVVVPAKRFRITVTVTGKGADEKAAEAALGANRAKLVQLLAARGIQEGQPIQGAANNPLSSLFSAFGGRGKTSFSLDTFNNSDEKPQATANEKIFFDAPTRAAAEGAKPLVEANDGKMDEDVIALLDDYVLPTRQAKADAIAKAREEAAAYGAMLGLKRVAIVRISEKQDIVAGSMSFFYQLIAMFAPKGGTASDSVTVSANLAVEFQLSK
jgi:uncharacterized protein YggE